MKYLKYVISAAALDAVFLLFLYSSGASLGQLLLAFVWSEGAYALGRLKGRS